MIKLDIDPTKKSELRSLAGEPLAIMDAAATSLEKALDLEKRSDVENALRATLSAGSAEALTDMLISFSTFVDGSETDLPEVLTALLEGAKNSGIENDILSALSERIPFIERMCRAPRIRQLGKVREIREALGPQLSRAKIFTSSSPIFDQSRTAIDGAIIISTLRLEFTNAKHEQDVFEVALTAKQLLKMKEEIERGLLKIESYKNFLTKSGLNWLLTYEK